MKDILHTGTWRGFVLAAVLYVLFSVLPALLILGYVIQIDLAILMAVLVVQAVLFKIFRKKFYVTATQLATAVCGLLESSPREVDSIQDHEVTEVSLESQEIHSICFLMLWIAGMSVVGVDVLLPWSIELQFPLADLRKLIGGLIVLFVIHEALHGLAAMAWGRIPIKSLHFGVNMRLMALYCHADRPMAMSAYRAVALLPLIVTTPAAALNLLINPAIWSVLLLCATFAGGAGDVMVFFKARRYDNDTWIQDHASEVGFITFPPGETPVR